MIHSLPITIWIFPFSKVLADVVLGASGPPAFHAWAGQDVVADRRPVGQVGRCLPLDTHPGRCVAVQICQSQPKEAPIGKKKCSTRLRSPLQKVRIDPDLDFKIINS